MWTPGTAHQGWNWPRWVRSDAFQPVPLHRLGHPVETPWWMDPQYQIGLLSLNVRPIKLLNTLTQQEHELEVPGEETLNEILTRCARRLKLPVLVARFPRPRADRRALAAGTCRTIRTRLRTHGSSWGMCWT